MKAKVPPPPNGYVNGGSCLMDGMNGKGEPTILVCKDLKGNVTTWHR